MISAPLLELTIPLDDASGMLEVATATVLIEHLGDRGAAVVAYVCRELAANAIDHGSGVGSGAIRLTSGSRLEIVIPGDCFDSVAHESTSGGLAICRKLLATVQFDWSHERRSAGNCTIITLTAKSIYGALV
jgi:hypothetical protein